MKRSLRPTLTGIIAAAALVVTLGIPASPTYAAAPVRAAAIPAPPVATTFAMPLKAKSYTAVSYYGARCIPLPGASTYHLGLDLAAPGGDPIYAIADGVVAATLDGTKSTAGYIKLRHNIGGVTYTSIYYHIWKSTTRVKTGQIVKAGQHISEVGTSGVSGGNHLHLEVWKGEPGKATSTDPAPFLKSRGVDLYGKAKAVTASKAPKTCTYYVSSPVNFRTGPSTSYTSLKVLPTGTSMVHVPGNMTNGFIPVTVAGQSGWVSGSYVTSTKPRVTTPAVTTPTPASVTVKKPATYKAKAAVNFRKSASLKGKKIRVIPKGANVGVIKASKGVWRKVTYKGKTGWVHSSYLKKR